MNTKEFEKQTLEQLLIDLKDIDNYKSFRKGVFVYDLGHYQGQLLLQEIERLNNIINDLLNRQNEALRYIGNHLSLDSRYKHGNGDKELTIVRDILNKHIKELKGE